MKALKLTPIAPASQRPVRPLMPHRSSRGGLISAEDPDRPFIIIALAFLVITMLTATLGMAYAVLLG